MTPPIRVVETLPGTRLSSPASPRNSEIWDLGRNFAGVARINVTGPARAGTKVAVRYGELLYPDGKVNVMTSVAGQVKSGNGGPCAPEVAYQADELILPELGAGENYSFAPSFTWHGFRYAEVSVVSAEDGASNDRDGDHNEGDNLRVTSVQGLAMRSDVARTGFFLASPATPTGRLLNEIVAMCENTHSSNMMSVQSDCPHRERFGYGGDVLATAETAFLLYDVSQFYRKRVLDFNDAQRSDGGMTETAPFVGIADNGLGDQSGPIGWDTGEDIMADVVLVFFLSLSILLSSRLVSSRLVSSRLVSSRLVSSPLV